MARCRPNGT